MICLQNKYQQSCFLRTVDVKLVALPAHREIFRFKMIQVIPLGMDHIIVANGLP
jgi:hypothetical protein